MKACALVAAGLAVLLLVLVAVLAYAGLRLARVAAAVRAAAAGWARQRSPLCMTDLSPPVCTALLAAPGPPPDPRRLAAGFDPAAALYAVRVVGRLTAFIGGAPGSGALLALPGLGPARLVYTPQDPQPFAAVWAAPGGELAVAAFRGSLTVADLVADLAYGEARFAARGAAARVHAGMDGVYQSVKAALFAAVPPGARALFAAGHSLGAAVAFLFAFDAAAPGRPGPLVAAVGLAPPRVGNPAFAAALARRARAATLVNLADCVPTLPWAFMPNLAAPGAPDAYAHVPPVAAFSNAKPDITSCHGLPAYLEGLWAGPVLVPPVNGGGA